MLALANDARLSRIEFSSEKSKIIPLKRPPRAHPWQVQIAHNLALQISECQQSTYLGVIISRNVDTFNLQKREIVSKARRTMWSMWKIITVTGSRNWYGPVAWAKFVLPVILYGTEAMVLSNAILTKLQTIQNRFFKLCFGVTRRTSTAAITLFTGVLPIKAEYEKRLLCYFKHCFELPEHRMVKQAVLQQRIWSYHDDKNWFDRVRKVHMEHELWRLLVDEQAHYLALTKGDIKRVFRARVNRNIWRLIRDNQALNHISYEPSKPHIEISTEDSTIYWLRIKMGGVPFTSPHVTIVGDANLLALCPLCHWGTDSLRHNLLFCDTLNTSEGYIAGWSAHRSATEAGTEHEDLFMSELFAPEQDRAVLLQLGEQIRRRLVGRFGTCNFSRSI